MAPGPPENIGHKPFVAYVLGGFPGHEFLQLQWLEKAARKIKHIGPCSSKWWGREGGRGLEGEGLIFILISSLLIKKGFRFFGGCESWLP